MLLVLVFGAIVALALSSLTAAGATARGVVGDIRALPAPDGAEVMVSGRTADLVDLLDSLADRLPWMALLVAASTFVLPVKAIATSAVSIGASFGAVVWVFQDGHLAGLLGFTPTGDLEATQLILMLAILFGLSTDYEVFLLSRVRAEWERTGRIITSAAMRLLGRANWWLPGPLRRLHRRIGIADGRCDVAPAARSACWGSREDQAVIRVTP